MNDRQSKLLRAQEELSSGRKVLVASDDPMAAADAERARSQLRRIDVQRRMDDFARNMLGQAEVTLSRVTDLYQSLREGFVQAGNGSLAAGDRVLLATQFRGYREELLTLANRSDAAGGYVFGGQGSAGAPFAPGAPVSYLAQAGEQQVGLDASVPTSLDGRAAFMTVQTASGMKSIFSVIDDAIAVLEDASASPAAVSAAVTGAIGGMDAALELVQIKRTQAGEHMRAIDSREQLAESGRIELQAQLSKLIDLDFSKSLSDFALNQTAQQAAMRTYSEISKMSLFDYL